MAQVTKKKPPQSKWDRDDNYRKEFLKHNKGLFGCIYICAYCGRPMLRSTMQVDHHLAINHVKHSPMLKLWFGLNNIAHNAVNRIKCAVTGEKFVKMQGVNVAYNLLPACPKCNNKKSDKGGMWTVRGYIGGTIWKILNGINNVFLWAWSQPIFRLAVIGFLAITVLQFAIGGTGLIAAMLGWADAFFKSLAAGIGVLFGIKAGI